MISSIDKLENMGIYDNIPPKRCQNFQRYNLIYGWNGSGKSTLSRLFAFLGGQKIPDEKEKIKATITCNNIQYIEKNFPIKGENIIVFNEDFINDNINWNGTIKSILLLDERNIKETEKYNALKDFLYGKDETKGQLELLQNDKENLEKADAELQKVLTNIGKVVKNNYNILETSDTYYLNYDKRKVLALINDIDNPLSECDIMNKEELDNAIKQAKPIKKAKIEYKAEKILANRIGKLIETTEEIVSRKVASKILTELRDNQRLSDWVNEGLNLHKESPDHKCAFCGNVIDDDRIEELEAHFSDALSRLNADIEVYINNWELLKLKEREEYMDTSLYYDELVNDIENNNKNYALYIKPYNNLIQNCIDTLNKKKNMPFDIIPFDNVSKGVDECCNRINGVLDVYNDTISKHNEKTDTFEETTRAIKKKIERHYVQEQIKGVGYKTKVNEYNKKKEKLNSEIASVREKENEFLRLEGILSNETLGAEEFNEKLEKFLGYDEIKLKFDSNEKGYKIYRNQKQEASNLSEGEKTAIAFIYFITKIKESGRKIEDCIIVIDDPISSFDSNKLFSSYAYMKSECENAKQLFVLTHNYNYFSLVLGWFNKRNKKDPVTGKKIPDFSLYRVENRIVNEKRVAMLCDGGESLKQATEYDYVFFTVYGMKDKVLSKQESIFCGNVCRKLVESFLSFKFPKQRADLMALLNAALPGKANDIVRERIYKFINIYSHDKKINVFEELDADILDANSIQIINDILDMIRNLDEKHYNAMIDKYCDEVREVVN